MRRRTGQVSSLAAAVDPLVARSRSNSDLRYDAAVPGEHGFMMQAMQVRRSRSTQELQSMTHHEALSCSTVAVHGLTRGGSTRTRCRAAPQLDR